MFGNRDIDAEEMDLGQRDMSDRPEVKDIRILHVMENGITHAVFFAGCGAFRGGMSKIHLELSSWLRSLLLTKYNSITRYSV
jgi:hypothetical protein